jgi:hypothetical protein
MMESTRECQQNSGQGAEAADAAEPAVIITARRAANGAALLRVVAQAMQFFCPQAKLALAACFLHLPRVDAGTQPDDESDAAQLTLSVEAVGSGSVIVPALRVDGGTTVGALKALIDGRYLPASPGTIRLFVGHGGEELADDMQPIRAAAAVADGATLALVRVSPQETLIRLFEATGGDAGWWHRRHGWSSSFTTPLPAWHGVVCDKVCGGVDALALSSNGLRGTFVCC